MKINGNEYTIEPEADLRWADLRGADLSGAKGLLSPSAWMEANFEFTDKGVIVYKAFGDTHYNPPGKWKIEAGEYIEEVANPNRTDDCGCGVNFATLDWISKEWGSNITVWKCLIEWRDLPAVVVPYITDGKARCERLQLIEIVPQ